LDPPGVRGLLVAVYRLPDLQQRSPQLALAGALDAGLGDRKRDHEQQRDDRQAGDQLDEAEAMAAPSHHQRTTTLASTVVTGPLSGMPCAERMVSAAPSLAANARKVTLSRAPCPETALPRRVRVALIFPSLRLTCWTRLLCPPPWFMKLPSSTETTCSTCGGKPSMRGTCSSACIALMFSTAVNCSPTRTSRGALQPISVRAGACDCVACGIGWMAAGGSVPSGVTVGWTMVGGADGCAGTAGCTTSASERALSARAPRRTAVPLSNSMSARSARTTPRTSLGVIDSTISVSCASVRRVPNRRLRTGKRVSHGRPAPVRRSSWLISPARIWVWPSRSRSTVPAERLTFWYDSVPDWVWISRTSRLTSRLTFIATSLDE